jgi:hypothetical protein
VETLHRYALGKDGTSVRVPKYFSDATRLRLQLVRLYRDTVSDVWNAEQNQRYLELIVKVVTEVDVSVGERLAKRLREVFDNHFAVPTLDV